MLNWKHLQICLERSETRLCSPTLGRGVRTALTALQNHSCTGALTNKHQDVPQRVRGGIDKSSWSNFAGLTTKIKHSSCHSWHSLSADQQNMRIRKKKKRKLWNSPIRQSLQTCPTHKNMFSLPRFAAFHSNLLQPQCWWLWWNKRLSVSDPTEGMETCAQGTTAKPAQEVPQASGL